MTRTGGISSDKGLGGHSYEVLGLHRKLLNSSNVYEHD
jgi:hypothetical protein